MRTYLLSLCLLLAIPVAHATSPMTVQTLLAEHAKAVGPIDQVKSRRIRLHITGMAPFELPVVTEAARPNLLRKDVSIQANTLVTAFDGKEAWKIDPFVSGGDKPMALPAAEARALAGEADFDGMLVNSAAKGIKLSYAGPAVVDGKPSHALTATLPDGAVTTIWFDAATFLEVKRTQPVLINGQMQPIDMFSSDWRLVGNGIRMPFRIESSLPGATQKMVIVIDAAEMNVKLDPSRFAKPAAK